MLSSSETDLAIIEILVKKSKTFSFKYFLVTLLSYLENIESAANFRGKLSYFLIYNQATL